jgi:hypothetical protein
MFIERPRAQLYWRNGAPDCTFRRHEYAHPAVVRDNRASAQLREAAGGGCATGARAVVQCQIAGRYHDASVLMENHLLASRRANELVIQVPE